MYLDKKQKNRLSVGKLLRKEKQLRKKDTSATRLAVLSPQLQVYKKELQDNGLIVGEIEVGLFQTKNGLKYPGFIAKEKINANSVLLRVPVQSLLTTRDAYLSDIQKVFQQNPKFYSKTFSSDWQDRILLTYLLYQYQKGKESRWYHLLQNLPKDIDYVAFWPEQELQYLEDEWVKKGVKHEKQRVLKEQQELISIIKRYPQFFQIGVFTSVNITWIHVHLVTRCFGKYFQYTTMVPYAQLFNHQCVDVYYTMGYKQDNPNNPHQQLLQPKQLTQDAQLQADTSEGSYEASDVSCEDEDFEQTEMATPVLTCPTALSSQYNSHHSYMLSFINFNDQVSLPFLQKIYCQIESSMQMQSQLALQRLKKVHPKLVKYLKLVKQFYFKISSNRYSYGLKQRKLWKAKQSKQNELQVDPKCNYFEGSWPKDKFDQFLMVCGSKDQFQEGSQVYFCYGRLPNRLLLFRYGISLQHNKYNHLFIRINISQFVYKSPHLQRAVQMDVALKKYRKFKIKRTVFCLELVTFHRSLFWKYEEDPQLIFYIIDLQREKQALRLTKSIIQQKLDTYSCSIQQNQQRLLQKQVGYHEYFAIVYRIQQQRILKEQLKMIAYAMELVDLMQKGNVLEDLLRKQANQIRLRWQIMMEVYFRSFKYF